MKNVLMKLMKEVLEEDLKWLFVIMDKNGLEIIIMNQKQQKQHAKENLNFAKS